MTKPAQTPQSNRIQDPAQARWQKLKQTWGLWLLAAFCLLSIVRLLLQAVPGHYRVFTGAGRAFFHLQNPYANDFGTNVGYYFYSPACALMVFGPLSLLPEKIGIITYMSVSCFVFVWGARQFWLAFSRTRNPALLQWFWFAITAQLVSGILASKLEILITGILLGGLALIRQSAPRLGRRGLIGAALLALILNWKFQPLPVVGLLCLAWLLIWRNLRLPIGIFCALVGWFALPFALFPYTYLTEIHETWQNSLTHFVSEAYLNFENIFTSIHHLSGWPISLHALEIVSAVTGLCLALYIAFWTVRASKDRTGGAMILSVGLGTMFMSAFSPLGQNNAMILYAPLLLCGFVHHERTSNPIRWAVILLATSATMTLAYSDLVPPALREQFRYLTVKPIACLVLGCALAWEMAELASPRVDVAKEHE